MIRRVVVSSAFACALAAPAAAHPGHGDPALASSWLHYLSEPGHLLVLWAVALACAGVVARRSVPER